MTADICVYYGGRQNPVKKSLFIFIILMISLIAAGCNNEDTSELNEETEELVETAESFIDHLDAGNYEEAYEYFDETMAAELQPDVLEEVWETAAGQLGGFIDHNYNRVIDRNTEAGNYQVVLMDGLFEASEMVFQISFNEENEIAGFFIQNPQ